MECMCVYFLMTGECQRLNNMFTILQVRCHCFERLFKVVFLNKVIFIWISTQTESTVSFWRAACDSHVRTVNCLRTDVKTAADFRNDITHPWDLRCISSLFKPLQCFSSHRDCDDSRPLVCDLKDYISLLMGSSAQLTPRPFTFTSTKEESACRAVTYHFFLL